MGAGTGRTHSRAFPWTSGVARAVAVLAGAVALMAGCATTPPTGAGGAKRPAMFDLVEAGNPESPFDAAMLAAFALLQRDPTAPKESARRAIHKADRALALDPRSSSMHLLRGTLYLAAGEVDTGLQDINRATALAPSVPDRKFSMEELKRDPATQQGLAGLLAQAKSARFPGDFVNPGSTSDVGMALIGRGPSFETADWTRLIEQDPESSIAFLMRAVSAFKRGYIDQGLYDIERHLRHNRIGSARFAELVMPWARGILASDPRVPRLLQGVAQSAKDDDRAAIQTLTALLADHPDYAAAQGELAWILATSPDARIRDGTRAVKHAEQAVARDPSGRNTRAF